NTNEKWKPLWSIGTGWNISDEYFYNIDYLPHLRITSTFGYSGNVDLSRSALPIAGYATDVETKFRFARITTINNPELRWETLSQFSVSLKGSSKNSRLNFS